MRTVQALAIAALVALFLVYSIPFGRNLKGILLGYGLFIGASVMWFTFRAVRRRSLSRFLVLPEPRVLRPGSVSLGCVSLESATPTRRINRRSHGRAVSARRHSHAPPLGGRPRIPWQGDGSMMPITLSIVSGVVLTIFLWRLWKNTHVSEAGLPFDANLSDEAVASCPGEFVAALFSPRDLEFVSQFDSEPLKELF